MNQFKKIYTIRVRYIQDGEIWKKSVLKIDAYTIKEVSNILKEYQDYNYDVKVFTKFKNI